MQYRPQPSATMWSGTHRLMGWGYLEFGRSDQALSARNRSACRTSLPLVGVVFASAAPDWDLTRLYGVFAPLSKQLASYFRFFFDLFSVLLAAKPFSFRYAVMCFFTVPAVIPKPAICWAASSTQSSSLLGYLLIF